MTWLPCASRRKCALESVALPAAMCRPQPSPQSAYLCIPLALHERACPSVTVCANAAGPTEALAVGGAAAV